MRVMIMNGSPKTSGSASEVFAAELARQLQQAQVILHEQHDPRIAPEAMHKLAGCDALVLVFPLYVDGIPSHLLQVLQELQQYMGERQGKRGPRVYALVNSGFHEGEQNRLALRMVYHWTQRAGLQWGMGIGIGGGPMLYGLNVPLGKGPKRSMGEVFVKLTTAILSGRTEEDCFASPNFPRRLYIAAAHMGWRMEARSNGVRQRALYVK